MRGRSSFRDNQIGSKAIESPIQQIVENAGAEGSIFLGKVMANKSHTFGSNTQSEEYVDLIEAGTIGVHSALHQAASIASLIPRRRVQYFAFTGASESKW